MSDDDEEPITPPSPDLLWLLNQTRLRFGKDATLIHACQIAEELDAALGLLMEETAEDERVDRFL